MKKLLILIGLFTIISIVVFQSQESEVGTIVMSDFTLENMDGETISITELRGKKTLINFWATWCPPCIEELPAMEGLNGRLRTKPFTMLAVSVDESWEPIQNFLKMLTRMPTFLILLDRDKYVANKLFGTEKFPETFLIGPDRRLLKKYVGSVNWLHPQQIGHLEAYFQKN